MLSRFQEYICGDPTPYDITTVRMILIFIGLSIPVFIWIGWHIRGVADGWKRGEDAR